MQRHGVRGDVDDAPIEFAGPRPARHRNAGGDADENARVMPAFYEENVVGALLGSPCHCTFAHRTDIRGNDSSSGVIVGICFWSLNRCRQGGSRRMPEMELGITRMSTAKRLALIGAGYAFAVVVGLAAAAINEFRMPADVAQASSGMVAFGDMILFVLVTGFFGLAPTWFLLKLAIEKAPRTLLVIELLVAVLGPVSWLTVRGLADEAPPPNGHQAIGLFIAFIAIPRMVFGPILLVVEAVTIVLVRERAWCVLLFAAMLMDIVPLVLFALHMLAATR